MIIFLISIHLTLSHSFILNEVSYRHNLNRQISMRSKLFIFILSQTIMLIIVNIYSERKPLMGGNWKLNPLTTSAATSLASDVIKLTLVWWQIYSIIIVTYFVIQLVKLAGDVSDVDVCVFPPFPFLYSVQAQIKDSKITVHYLKYINLLLTLLYIHLIPYAYLILYIHNLIYIVGRSKCLLRRFRRVYWSGIYIYTIFTLLSYTDND